MQSAIIEGKLTVVVVVHFDETEVFVELTYEAVVVVVVVAVFAVVVRNIAGFSEFLVNVVLKYKRIRRFIFLRLDY